MAENGQGAERTVCSWNIVVSYIVFYSQSWQLHQPDLLILRLTPLAPLWRFVVSCLLLRITLCFGLMHRSWVVLCWGVDRNYLERRVSHVQELVLGASWHDHDIILFDHLLLSSNNRFAGAVGKNQNLVHSVNLAASFS